METIQPGKFVAFAYDLYQVNPDGTETLVHQADPEDPETIVMGVSQGVVEPLEKELLGKAAGEKFDVVAKAEESFGERSDDYIIELEKSLFSVDGKFDAEMVKVGASLPMMTADGFQVYGTVIEVGANTVRMDFNHPLAGYSVRFKGSVIDVHTATEEEIAAQSNQGCGCGCGGNCGDGGCEGGCQGGCGN
jgi:FKBP-type peptidyl-prolyl cis-trans isomerase SlyD